jgi:CelD/BcsL family acetyltransferase involved in cellulose biosynthesis
MVTSADYKLRIYRGLEGLAAIRESWLALLSKMDRKGFWHYYEWYESYLEHLEPDPRRLFFYVLYDGSAALAILPFKSRQRRLNGVPLNILELPKHPHMKLKDILLPGRSTTDELSEVLMGELRRQQLPPWDAIVMHDLLPDACALRAFARISSLKIVEPHDTCDYINIDSGRANDDGMSKQLRKSLRVSNRRAAAQGPLTMTTAQSPEELEASLQAFLSIEASGWKGPQGTRTAIQCDPKLSAFYGDLVRKFGGQKACEVALLRLNGHPIAGTFSMVVDDTSYSLKIAYDETQSHLSPGNLQREKLIQNYSQRKNIRYLNLVSGNASPWHRRWNIDSIKTCRMFLFNRTPKGLFAYALMNTRRKMGSAMAGVGKTAIQSPFLDKFRCRPEESKKYCFLGYKRH